MSIFKNSIFPKRKHPGYKTIGVAALGAIVIWGTLTSSTRGQAFDSNKDEEALVTRGFEIAPVPLNLQGKDRALVGLGSYIVNAHAACNDCHDAGAPTQYANGGNPYFGQPKKINPATYLGGGQDFGPLVPGSAHIVSRNLTPDRTGRPEGGRSYAEFREILKTGIDLDHLHPTCANGLVNQSCVPPPFDGNLLQIMIWPTLQNMGEREIQAIYEYLSAIPCVAGPPPPSPLHNDCQ
jgi:hypothetical protein